MLVALCENKSEKTVASLFIIQGPNQGVRFELDARGGSAIVGREAGNRIQLHDTEVSRRHAEIQSADENFLLVDLGSSNGTFVNNERVEQKELASGDQVQVGRTVMLFTGPGDSGPHNIGQRVHIVSSAKATGGSRIVKSVSQQEGSVLWTPAAESAAENPWFARARSNLQVMYRTALAVIYGGLLGIPEIAKPGARRPRRRVVRERAPQDPPWRRPRLPPGAEGAPRAAGERPRRAHRAAPLRRARDRRRRAARGLSPRVRQRPVRQSPRAHGAAAVSRVSHDGRRYSNADDDRVELVDYDPGWPALFEAEAARLRAILASELGSFRLEHFGSTAIPGITAKPIIDIMLVSASPAGRVRRTHQEPRLRLLGGEPAERPHVLREGHAPSSARAARITSTSAHPRTGTRRSSFATTSAITPTRWPATRG